MKIVLALPPALTAALLAASCATPPLSAFRGTDFVGCYTTGTDWTSGGNELDVRVDESEGDGEYLVSFRRYDTRADRAARKTAPWQQVLEFRELDEEVIAGAFPEGSNRPIAALASVEGGDMALFRIEKGKRYGNLTARTDYLMHMLFFTRELSRTRCE